MCHRPSGTDIARHRNASHRAHWRAITYAKRFRKSEFQPAVTGNGVSSNWTSHEGMSRR